MSNMPDVLPGTAQATSAGAGKKKRRAEPEQDVPITKRTLSQSQELERQAHLVLTALQSAGNYASRFSMSMVFIARKAPDAVLDICARFGICIAVRTTSTWLGLKALSVGTSIKEFASRAVRAHLWPIIQTLAKRRAKLGLPNIVYDAAEAHLGHDNGHYGTDYGSGKVDRVSFLAYFHASYSDIPPAAARAAIKTLPELATHLETRATSESFCSSFIWPPQRYDEFTKEHFPSYVASRLLHLLAPGDDSKLILPQTRRAIEGVSGLRQAASVLVRQQYPGVVKLYVLPPHKGRYTMEPFLQGHDVSACVPHTYPLR
jgi:hypothetical protein